jgi:hypothetical protein
MCCFPPAFHPSRNDVIICTIPAMGSFAQVNLSFHKKCTVDAPAEMPAPPQHFSTLASLVVFRFRKGGSTEPSADAPSPSSPSDVSPAASAHPQRAAFPRFCQHTVTLQPQSQGLQLHHCGILDILDSGAQEERPRWAYWPNLGGIISPRDTMFTRTWWWARGRCRRRR